MIAATRWSLILAAFSMALPMPRRVELYRAGRTNRN